MAIYKGFSFNEKNFKLTDKELVDENMVTHINTPLGSRIHMPDWGTDIMDSMGDNMDQDMLYNFKTQLESVVEYEPRVDLLQDVGVVSSYDDSTVAGIVNVQYKLLNTTDTFEFSKIISTK